MLSFYEKARTWPGELVTRAQVPEFSGGVYKASSMRTLDSRGKGPAGRVLIGTRVAYPKHALAEWLDSKVRPISENHDPFA